MRKMNYQNDMKHLIEQQSFYNDCQFQKRKLIFEGKHWPKDYVKTARNMIKQSQLGQQSWYTDDFIDQDLKTFIDEFQLLSHKNSNLGYFSPIIRWFIEYAGTSKEKYQEFIERKLDVVIRSLLEIAASEELTSKYKDKIKQMKFSEFQKLADDLDKQKEASQEDKLKDIKIQDKGYELIPIYSYEELFKRFGGPRTGVNGKSEWCHTSGRSTYNSWTSNGTKMFFVLAKKDWQNIKPPTEIKTAYDAYGTSLIALLVSMKTGKLLNNTLRYNHIITPSNGSVDMAYPGYAELSELVGFNLRDKIKDALKIDTTITQDKKFDPNKKYKPGDVFKIMFDDEVLDVLVLGEKDGCTCVQFECCETIPFDKNMENDWGDSSSRKYLNSEQFIKKVDPEFMKHVVEATVHTEDYTTKDKFWLLSHEEIGFVDDKNWFMQNRGTKKLDYFDNTKVGQKNKKLIRYDFYVGSSVSSWWLRSASNYSSSYVGNVNYYGIVYYDIAYNYTSCVVAPAVLIK